MQSPPLDHVITAAFNVPVEGILSSAVFVRSLGFTDDSRVAFEPAPITTEDGNAN